MPTSESMKEHGKNIQNFITELLGNTIGKIFKFDPPNDSDPYIQNRDGNLNDHYYIGKMYMEPEVGNPITQIKYINYNPDTKELKFQVNAKVSPFTVAKAGLSGTKTTTSNKNMTIKVNAVVTLP